MLYDQSLLCGYTNSPLGNTSGRATFCHTSFTWCIAYGRNSFATTLAKEFRPYAMHHVKDVWQNVARPLVLPSGEFVYPQSNDWSYNISITPSYYAFIATELGD